MTWAQFQLPPMNAKSCSRCHHFKPLAEFTYDKSTKTGRHHRCLECERIRTADRQHNGSLQRSNRRWQRNNPQAVAAQRLVQKAVKLGKLKRQPCEVCGTANASHAHHADYAKPLAVTWLCQFHHKEHHRLERLYGSGQFLFGFMEMEGGAK